MAPLSEEERRQQELNNTNNTNNGILYSLGQTVREDIIPTSGKILETMAATASIPARGILRATGQVGRGLLGKPENKKDFNFFSFGDKGNSNTNTTNNDTQKSTRLPNLEPYPDLTETSIKPGWEDRHPQGFLGRDGSVVTPYANELTSGEVIAERNFAYKPQNKKSTDTIGQEALSQKPSLTNVKPQPLSTLNSNMLKNPQTLAYFPDAPYAPDVEGVSSATANARIAKYNAEINSYLAQINGYRTKKGLVPLDLSKLGLNNTKRANNNFDLNQKNLLANLRQTYATTKDPEEREYAQRFLQLYGQNFPGSKTEKIAQTDEFGNKVETLLTQQPDNSWTPAIINNAQGDSGELPDDHPAITLLKRNKNNPFYQKSFLDEYGYLPLWARKEQ